MIAKKNNRIIRISSHVIHIDHFVSVERAENTDNNACHQVLFKPDKSVLQAFRFQLILLIHAAFVPSLLFLSSFIPSQAGILTVRIITA